MEDNDEIVARLIELAQNADSAQQLVADGVEETLLDEVEAALGSWEAGLAAALVKAVSSGGGRSSTSRRTPAKAEVERTVTAAHGDPIYVETTDGRFYAMPGPELSVDERAQTPGAEDETQIRAIHYAGDNDGMYLFSDEGRYFGLDARTVPDFSQRTDRRSIRDILFLSGEESIRAVLPRRRMGVGRVVHVTRGGKAKATDAGKYDRDLDRSGRQAFKVRDGDTPIAVMGIGDETTIFCASAMGRGIHFEDGELRSMGRKAIGVNAMKLEGDDDAIVDAFEGRRVKQLAVITAEGLGKRVDFSEFRTQGRNGKGMQLARLNPGDAIAGVVACNPARDVAITTDRGRVWRIPARNFYMMGRSAKGNQMVELASGERIIDLEELPCGSDD